MNIDYYLNKPYWLIDVLPKQVEANGRGQYFKIEEYFLKEPQIGLICKKFSSLLIKLNCYTDFSFYYLGNEDSSIQDDSEKWIVNPSPEQLSRSVTYKKAFYIILESEDTMISYAGDDHYMTIYNPNDSILELVTALAESEGLFVWKHL